MNSFIRKLGWLTQRRNKEVELADELRFHLEEEAEGRRAAGLPDDDARWAARRELGNVGLVEEDTRSAWGWISAERLIQDLRYAARTMLHNPAFTILAALSLALGIGANTAIYSFMDALLLRSLPVANPKSLVVLTWHRNDSQDSVIHDVSGSIHDGANGGLEARIFPYFTFELLQNSAPVFSSLFAYHPTRKLNLMVKGQAEIAAGEYVSGNYFEGLGTVPAAGRLIVGDDDRVGAPGVAVLSFAYSRRRFGDAASAAGQPILINNVPFTVIGVTAPEFFGVDPGASPSVFLPLHADFLLAPKWEAHGDVGKRYLDRNYYWLEMMARLRPGVKMPQAQAALELAFHRWVATTAANDAERKILPELSLMEGAGGLETLRRKYSEPLYVLLAMVALILAIACANVANLLLARAAARRREIAVRLSMGAGRWRVIRQLLTESVLLASIGGAVGVLFAIWGVRFLTVMLANGNADFTLQPVLNWRVLGVAAALSMITGIAFGLAPALQATRVDVMPVLREVRAGERRRKTRLLPFTLSQALVTSQVAVSLLLLVGAGLFVRTLSNLHSVELGFRPENILLFKLNARQAGHPDPEIISFYGGLQQRFAAIPGVQTASMANSPLLGEGAYGTPVVPAGQQLPLKAPQGHGSGFPRAATHILAAGPGFFSTMRSPIVAGREFDGRDRPGSLPVAIVNEAWLRVNLPNGNPIGQHVVMQAMDPGQKPREMQIVGVAKNARYDDLVGEFPAVVYLPFEQHADVPIDEMTFALRTTGDPLAQAIAVREIVHEADARIPVTNIRTQTGQIDQMMNQEIVFARLCAGFAILALTIACVGLYGTMSYMVARRTGEIGIRMALGAWRGRVIRMVMRQAMAMAIAGLVIGVPIAYVSSRLVESFLFGVKPNDPTSLGIAIGTLIIAAAAAGYAPARRASRIDPMVALRHE